MPTLWITYAWSDNTEGDFSYLVQQLESAGITVRFDRVALVPGHRLWEQIGTRIAQDPLDGWAYLVTANSLASQPCREELAYALDRALREKGQAFPLIGLLHGVRIVDVPPALRIRLCVDLASPNWVEEVKAGLEARAPQAPSATQGTFVFQLHPAYGGEPDITAVEIRPRFGEIMYWRIAVPTSAVVAAWGHGPSGGGAISFIQTSVITGGDGQMDGVTMEWFGAGDRLSPGISAYVAFRGEIPDFLAFGLATAPAGPPSNLERLSLR
jgi:hypothetical protein